MGFVCDLGRGMGVEFILVVLETGCVSNADDVIGRGGVGGGED